MCRALVSEQKPTISKELGLVLPTFIGPTGYSQGEDQRSMMGECFLTKATCIRNFQIDEENLLTSESTDKREREENAEDKRERRTLERQMQIIGPSLEILSGPIKKTSQKIRGIFQHDLSQHPSFSLSTWHPSVNLLVEH
ncbi:hypothetical protein mRhiFer1_008863 [Rhinolophus ferrumequinum]|uniref:Uncharacterized protein n=1 Tax=Rhinolophus ferrumequinum TaxID=59479 RepID=A0A7J8AFR2_RHIFE|nr:hypothetical protein mRhiFer1_008863 [Rhinolophus ferrumequinum]